MKKYSEEHVWIATDDSNALLATVGITVHAQDVLGDIVFVDLPAIGAVFDAGASAGVVESVKAAADVYIPAGGTVVEVNEALRADTALANTDPLGAGWFFKITLTHAQELNTLMDEAAYANFAP